MASCALSGSQQPLVVLVTAERDTALRRQAAERGWGFLLKPVRPSALRALISQMLLRQREAGPSDRKTCKIRACQRFTNIR